VKELGVPVDIATTEAHVPSFMEKWVFIQITRLEGEIKEEVDVSAEQEHTVVNGGDAPETKSEPAAEEKKEEVKEDKKDEKKEAKDDKKKASTEKKDEKKGGAKSTKESLESPKEKGLTKEKSNLDKKTKKAK